MTFSRIYRTCISNHQTDLVTSHDVATNLAYNGIVAVRGGCHGGGMTHLLLVLILINNMKSNVSKTSEPIKALTKISIQIW